MASTQRASRKSVLNQVTTIGLDLAKTTVHFVGLNPAGQVLTRRQYSKGKLLEVTATVGPCRIGMEACCGAHHLGRKLLAQGHDVRLMPPKYVKPFVKRDKNDTTDAEACAEACLRPTMRFVTVKSEAQLSMQSLHRYRSRLVSNSTQLINQARGFLLERGLAIPQGKHRFAARLPEILEDADNGLPDPMRVLLAEMLAEWEQMEAKIEQVNRELVAEAKQCEACQRLREVPGIGAQTATALVAANRRRAGLREGARPGGVAGADAAGDLHRRQATTGRNQQKGKPLCANAAGALRPRGAGYAVEAHGWSGAMAATHAGDQGPACRDRSTGGPSGTDLLGHPHQRAALRRTASGCLCGLKATRLAEATAGILDFVCQTGTMDKQVAPASRKPVEAQWPLQVEHLMRTEARGAHRGPEPKRFHSEVEYIDADQRHRTSESRQLGSEPYIVPEVLGLQGVFADQQFPQSTVERMAIGTLDHPLDSHGGGVHFPDAMHSRIGLDPDDKSILAAVGLFLDFGKTQVESFDSSNFHGGSRTSTAGRNSHRSDLPPSQAKAWLMGLMMSSGT